MGLNIPLEDQDKAELLKHRHRLESMLYDSRCGNITSNMIWPLGRSEYNETLSAIEE